MPPSAQVRYQKLDFEHIIDHVFTKFIDAFVKGMIDAFSLSIWWPVPKKYFSQVSISKIFFPNQKYSFQSKNHVSNLKILFPI